MAMIIAGVNGGGTKTEAICCNERGMILGKGSAGPSNYHNVGIETAMRNISAAISGTGHPDPDVLCVALAAINSEKDRMVLERALKRIKRGAILEHDAYAEMYAETRGRPGIMIVAGTGSVVMGYDGRQRHRRCDMGWFLGDEGSGYFIGKEGLRAAARMVFEEGQSTQITAEIVAQLHLRSPEDIMAWAYSDRNTVKSIANLSRAVESAAKKGDRVAIAIINTASSTLADAVVSMSKEHGMHNAYFKDGVFNIQLYRSNFTGILERNGIAWKRMQGSPAIGPLLLAADSAGLDLRIRQ